MVATLNQSTRQSNITNQTVSNRSAQSFLNSSRLSDLHDDVTMEALRCAAAIRKTWSEEEVARREKIGQLRRDELNQLLGGLAG